MKCRICGANVEGTDLCENCEKEVLEEDVSKNNKEKVFTIKRKYSIKYEVFKCWPVYFIFLLGGAATGKTSSMVICLILMLVILGFDLFWYKRVSKVTYCKFYSKKIEFKNNLGLVNKEKKMTYKNVDCVRKDQTWLQRFFGYGDVLIYPKTKNVLTNNILTQGIQVKNVANVNEIIEKINEIIEKNK